MLVTNFVGTCMPNFMNSRMHNCNYLTFNLMFLRHTIRLKLVARLDIIYYPLVFVFIHISVKCDKEKKTVCLIISFYSTFALS